MHLSPKHIFKASDHDNQAWNQAEDGPFGNTQSLQAINKYVQHARLTPTCQTSPSFCIPVSSVPFPLVVLTLGESSPIFGILLGCMPFHTWHASPAALALGPCPLPSPSSSSSSLFLLRHSPSALPAHLTAAAAALQGPISRVGSEHNAYLPLTCDICKFN